jgi:hypothetical protein
MHHYLYNYEESPNAFSGARALPLYIRSAIAVAEAMLLSCVIAT